MALRATRQFVDVLAESAGDIYVTRQFVEVLIQPIYTPTITSTITFSQTLGRETIIERDVISPITYQQTIGLIGPHILAATSAITFDSQVYIPQTYILSAINNITFDQSAIYTYTPGVLDIVSEITYLQFADIDIKVRSVESTIDFQQNATYTSVIKIVSASNDIIFQHEAKIAGTINVEAESILTSDDMIFDGDDFVDISHELGQTATRQAIFSRICKHYYIIDHAVQVGHIKASAPTKTATSTITFLQEAIEKFAPFATSNIDYQQTATGIVCTPLKNTIVFDQSVDYKIKAKRELTNAITFYVSIGYELTKSDTYCTYSPFIGGTSIPGAPTPPAATLEQIVKHKNIYFYYPTENPTISFTLRGPEFGNVDRHEFQRINRETRGGTLIIKADPIWPKRQHLLLEFVGLSESEMQDGLTFINNTLGKRIGLRDWMGRHWRGIILSPQNPIIQDARNTWSFAVEIDARRIYFGATESTLSTLSQLAVAVLYQRPVGNTITFVQTLDREVRYERDPSHNITFAQTIDREIIYERDLTAPISFNQTVTVIAIYQRSLTSTIVFTQTLNREVKYERDPSSPITFTETASREAVFDRSSSSPITFTQTAIVQRIRKRYWVGSTSSWNTAGNWAYTSGGSGGAGVPDSVSDVYFDGSDVTDCTTDVAPNIKSLTIENGYTGIFDVNHNVTISDDLSIGNACNLKMGSGTWEIAGNVTSNLDYGIGDLEPETSTLKLTGNSKTLTMNAGKFFNVRIDGDINCAGSACGCRGLLDVYGTFTCPPYSYTWNMIDSGNQSIKLQSGGTIDGYRIKFWTYNATNKGIEVLDGTFDLTQLDIYYPDSDNYWVAGDYSGITNINVYTQTDYVDVFRLQAGAYTFNRLILRTLDASCTGSLTMDNNTNGPSSITINADFRFLTHSGSSADLAVDNSGQAVDWIFKEDFIITHDGTGTLTWTKGTGDITINGTGAQAVNFYGFTTEEIIINKSGGAATFGGNVTCDFLTHSAGTVDFNGKTITTVGDFTISAGADVVGNNLDGGTISVGGNCSLNGQSSDLLDLHADATWYLQVTGTASANYVDADYSDASGYTQVSATNSNDGGNNTNWNFS